MNKKVLTISGFLLLLIAILFWYFIPQNLIFTDKKEVIIEKITPTENTEVKAITTAKKIVSGHFTQPLYNNTKSILLFTDDEGHNLYLKSEKDTEPQLLLTQNGMNNNFGWSKNGEEVFFKEKTTDYKTIIKSININTKKITIHSNLSPLTELKAIIVSDTTYFLGKKTLAVKANFKANNWDITTKDGNYYSILVSPNNKYVIAHKGADILLFKTSGEFIKILGQGIATSWHPNSKKLIGFLDSSDDGVQISNSELYLFHINRNTTQITHTPNQIEMWPIFKNENEIIYQDVKQNGIFSISL